VPEPTSSDSDILTISLAPWYEGSDAGRAEVVALVDRSLSDMGFMVVADHGVDPDLPTRVREVLLEFFTGPEEIKESVRVDRLGDRGWVPYGLEANGYIFGEDTPPDMKESFVVGMDVLGRSSSMTTRWPAAPAGMRDLVVEYTRQVEQLHIELMRLCAVALGLDDPEHFVARESASDSVMNINWYPPLLRTGPVQENQYRIGPHTDFGTVTILDRQPGTGCLQVQDASGEWRDAEYVPGSLTINVGDLLEMWSGGRWRSSRHRVLPPSEAAPEEGLMSLVFFGEPDDDTVIAPLLDGDDFEPVRARDFLNDKIAAITVA
jgi:isopenicillin N synthase-like dioxygenase